MKVTLAVSIIDLCCLCKGWCCMWSEDWASKGYIVSFRITVNLETSSLCVPVAGAGPYELCVLGIEQVPTGSGTTTTTNMCQKGW
jgi:hypothetical protein